MALFSQTRALSHLWLHAIFNRLRRRKCRLSESVRGKFLSLHFHSCLGRIILSRDSFVVKIILPFGRGLRRSAAEVDKLLLGRLSLKWHVDFLSFVRMCSVVWNNHLTFNRLGYSLDWNGIIARQVDLSVINKGRIYLVTHIICPCLWWRYNVDWCIGSLL